MGLVVGRNFVRCLVIIVIFMSHIVIFINSSFGVAMQATMGDSFYGEGRFSLCNTGVLKHYGKSLLGTVKHFIGYYLFSLYFCYFTCFVSVEIGKDKNAIKTVLKFIRLTLSCSVW